MDAYRQDAEAVATTLGTHLQNGLSASEARTRLARDGPNLLAADEPVPAWRRLLNHFQDVLVLLLLGAAVISGVLWAVERETALPYEAFAILAVVLVNAAMGYIQEARAETSLAALRQMSAADATVIRDGQRANVPAADLVVGDIILVEEGDKVPADARLVDAVSLQAAEAALTGESLPVAKDVTTIAQDAALGDRRNMIFSGTSASHGHGTAIVTAIGMQSEMGRIAGLLKNTPAEVTPLQAELDRVGKRLGLIVVAIAAVMITTIFIVEDVSGTEQVFGVLILGVALAVAAVPEGLPAVVTAVLSIGVQRMAKRNAIVRHLAAVETLGSATVIASDKTGTLTKNEMTVRTVVTASGRVAFEGTGYAPDGEVHLKDGGPVDGPVKAELDRALTAADRANNAKLEERDGQWTSIGDPTEGALLVAARKAGLTADALEARFPRLGEVPFSSERKLMSTIHRDAERQDQGIAYTKGAPDVLLTKCRREAVGDGDRPLTQERCAQILQLNEDLAGEALRTLGVAERRGVPAQGAGEEVEQDLTFLGLLGMIDPPRPEAKEAVAGAARAGIRTLMITGDHPRTGSVIARELQIASDDDVVSGADLDGLGDDALPERVKTTSVYARVNPEHKLRIVAALKSQGAIVAMTGDGVNDAPALKAADIGVAMGISGTDVSKEAADIVLTDDNFASIVAAVEEGRAIFDNIRKFLRYLLSSNVGEVLTMFFGVALAGQIGLHAEAGPIALPLVATQILWINLVTDGLPALALGIDPPEPGLMARPPRPPNEGVLTWRMWRGILFVGVIMAGGTLYVIDASLPQGFVEGDGTLRYAQSMAFTTLMLFQMFNVLNARSDDRSAFAGMFANRWLWAAMAASIALQFAVLTVPALQQAFATVELSPSDWLHCAAVASTVLWLREISKLISQRTPPGVSRSASASS